MPMRPLRGERVLAVAAAVVGVVGIVSALTPEFADRSDFVRGVLPPGVPGAARVLALAFGLALVWLSRLLARRRRRAWQLAVALVTGISIAHLAKGLDVEEATLGFVLLVALLRYRSRFDVPGDPRSVRPLLATALALLALAALAFVLELRGLAGDRWDNILAAVTLLLATRALYLWFRPFSGRVRQSAEERRLVRRLVRGDGQDSLAFFSLRRDKSYFFSPTRRSFLAYKVVGGAALVSGDPIGAAQEFPELLSEFRRVCHARGWRLALLSIRGELLPLTRRLGLRAIKIGDEAVVRPAAFSLEGRPIRKVRQSVERGFSMAMDDLYREEETLFALAGCGGRIGGFLHLVPSADGYSLGAMRRDRDTPNGLMEYLIVQLLLWAREHGTAEISLNFCVFADLLARTPRNALDATARSALRVGDRIFQLERLLVFSRKFDPDWRPRYLCVECLSDLPLVGVAYLRVESLLTPPGPWARRAALKV
ncbi:MAG: DUF2156 domain-containing protein [Actinobacteria bacterium]|nr:MAG: DUF2156 domain-containing protein [Actinomycetota bacterium]